MNKILPTFIIAIAANMVLSISGELFCDPDPFREYSCFTIGELQYYRDNPWYAAGNCTIIKGCCYVQSLQRCHKKSVRTNHATAAPPQGNYVRPQTKYNPYQTQNQQQNYQPYVPPQQQSQNYNNQPYVYPNNQQQGHPGQTPYQTQSQQPSQQYYPSNNQQQYPYQNTASQTPQQPSYLYNQPSQQYIEPNQLPYQSSSNHQSQYPQQNTNQQYPYAQQSSGSQSKNNNINNLLSALNMPTRAPTQQYGQQQGALGTSVSAAIPKQSVGLPEGVSQCNIVAGLQDATLREQLGGSFGCTGNEQPIPQDQAQSLLQNLVGQNNGGGGGSAPPPAGSAPAPAPAAAQLPDISLPAISNPNAVGSRLPNYDLQPYRPPATNPTLCLALKSQTSTAAAIMKLQYRCGETGNTLIDLATGNGPQGLDAIPNIISAFGLTADAPTVTLIKEGSINPNLVPSDVLSKCITNRYTYPSCRQGYDVNINTEAECFNVGCLFFRDTYGTRCFRCDLVPASAYRLQDSADTCDVAEPVDCPGFKTFQFSVFTLDLNNRQTGISLAPTLSPFASLFSGNPALSALLQSNPSLLSSLGRSGATRQLDTSTLLSLFAGGSGANPLLSGLLGQSSSSSSSSTSNALLLSALSGNGLSSSAFNVPKLSPQALTQLKSTCETKGCCWKADAANRLGGTCFQKGVNFPTSCLPTPDSGTCGKSLDTSGLQRIIGGTSITSSTSRPWMVMIQTLESGNAVFKCGGVMICSQWVLTAASCLRRSEDPTILLIPSLIKVFVGTLNPAIPGPELGVERIIAHPGFTPLVTYHNDIALIKIRSLPFTAANSPICLPELKTDDPADGQVLYFTGYGKTSFTSLSTFSSLKELPFSVKSASHCNSEYPGSVLPQSGIFCAESSSDTDTCDGDGGSPIVQYNAATNVFTLIGIHFAGSSGCDGTKPALFTSVAKFMPWIAQSTNGCCDVPGSRYVG